MEAAELLAKAKRIVQRAVSREDLELAHEPRYLELAEREIRGGYDHLSTGDTNIGPESWDATLAAVGCAMAAREAVVKGDAKTAFCLVRPLGHHANAVEMGLVCEKRQFPLWKQATRTTMTRNLIPKAPPFPMTQRKCSGASGNGWQVT